MRTSFYSQVKHGQEEKQSDMPSGLNLISSRWCDVVLGFCAWLSSFFAFWLLGSLLFISDKMQDLEGGEMVY